VIDKKVVMVEELKQNESLISLADFHTSSVDLFKIIPPMLGEYEAIFPIGTRFEVTTEKSPITEIR
jgi:hypothetical protein